MNNGKLLKINELRLENNEYVPKACLINPSKIISIISGMLTKKGPALLGAEHEREARMITLEGNNHIFVEETADEILEKIK